ncbi:MAG: DNA mismatch repair endonuclease MutL [Bacteroidia bacterium]|nr:DNA mismatch repair endonuclease MutL [Bacteroidia bacterium]
MTDIIQLLPDSVANQIAAGEVIQRPASVVKELVENAVDAGSTVIKIIIKDAGKSLVHIIDNGCGMSETDARMSFERHATSKIKSAEDLFCIRTMGFRGEALASIAAISQVELKTKRVEDDLGTCILINASLLENQHPVSCPDGTSLAVKNLFFNVPARRKFLKSNQTEFRHILDEVQRIALANTDISFSLYHNDEEIYNLTAAPIKQRIINIFGKNLNQNLISIHTETSLAGIRGYIGKPEFARKTSGEQFFFVNNRYMRHPYFYKAALNAYEKILPPNTFPSFFIYFTIDPSRIDINIHPTKTEIKFADEIAIWQIIQATVREALGKFNVVPSIDFEIDSLVEIPLLKSDTDVKQPAISVNSEYNPFEKNTKKAGASSIIFDYRKKDNLTNWEKLYSGFENKDENISIQTEKQTLIQQSPATTFFQLKNKYILTPVKSGLMAIDQKRAYERILYERFLSALENSQGIVQKILFPKIIELQAADASLLKEILPDLNRLGFEINELGKNTFSVNGTPSDIGSYDANKIIEGLIENYKNSQVDIKITAREKIALSLAKVSAVNYSKPLANEEMQALFDSLFACSVPNYTPDGKLIISIFSNEEFEKRFK